MIQAAAAERNKNAILDILRKVLNTDTKLNGLEIASGTGQHIVWFAQHLPNITWQPTEYDEKLFDSITAYRESDDEIKTRVNPPQRVDVTKPLDSWPGEVARESFYDFILNANMIHISPYDCTVGMFRAASKLLKKDGLVILYGPFAVDGVLTPESNIAFDRSLKSRDSSWGVRDTRDVIQTAQQFCIKYIQMFEMPANNKILIFQKSL